MRIAVVGSGISGLVATYLLQRHHEVFVFEANDYVGGHTNTVRVNWQGESLDIDTGFIVYNDWTYPNFIGLLNELNVPTQPTSMGFSVKCDRCGLEYAGTTFSTLFAQKRRWVSPGHYRMLWDILRFNREARGCLERDQHEVTLGDFLRRGRYSQSFAEHYLLPMGAAIWSCPMSTFEQFPVRFIAEFYRNHGLLNVIDRPTWRVIQGGSQSYVRQMLKQFQQQPRLSCPVQRVIRHSDSVEVHSAGGVEHFDEIVFACHSDQALRMLGDADVLERGVLSEFPYGDNIAVLHTDERVLPRLKSVWSSWNYHVRHDEQRPSVTYNMNILQNLDAQATYCVTLNEPESIDPDRVLGTFHYSHPIFTLGRAAAQKQQQNLIRHRRTSYCGAYWGNGFHEDGVVSALKVCAQFGVVPNWSTAEQTGAAKEVPLGV
ncbi:MAG: FAD-dependent oxidoreductase [Planctomycetaceae bacterium]|nr:FAD-dependent oxidoreductase [Planctomycetaceae bacterium]